MSPKSVLTIAAISLAVVLAHQHVAANGLPGAAGKGRIGNG
jgi:hypothetical protein